MLAARFDATPAEAQQLAGLVQGTPAPLAGARRCRVGRRAAGERGGAAHVLLLAGWPEAAARTRLPSVPRALCYFRTIRRPDTATLPLSPCADLPSLADEALLTKYLKVTAHELAVGSLAEAQLGRIAARDC